MYHESDYLLLSGLQHLRFCPRQCALIHIEQQWTENFFTASGRVLHEKVHSGITESRKVVRTERSLKIASSTLGLTGQTDAVEFYTDGRIIPVEYKNGKQKTDTCDEVQLCAQAMCLEEMLETTINEGALFYFKTRKRIIVPITATLREETMLLAKQFHALVANGITPEAVYTNKCKSCSLTECCFPESAGKGKSVSGYIKRQLGKEVGSSDFEEE